MDENRSDIRSKEPEQLTIPDMFHALDSKINMLATLILVLFLWNRAEGFLQIILSILILIMVIIVGANTTRRKESRVDGNASYYGDS